MKTIADINKANDALWNTDVSFKTACPHCSHKSSGPMAHREHMKTTHTEIFKKEQAEAQSFQMNSEKKSDQ